MSDLTDGWSSLCVRVELVVRGLWFDCDGHLPWRQASVERRDALHGPSRFAPRSYRGYPQTTSSDDHRCKRSHLDNADSPSVRSLVIVRRWFCDT